MIDSKRLLRIPAATGAAVIGKANQAKARTTNRKHLWKPLCGLSVLLFIPLTGRADVVQDWSAIMQATVTSQPPFQQARFAAITQLAVFEAVNAITREYKPYLGTITAPNHASPEAAAAAAAYGVRVITSLTAFPP